MLARILTGWGIRPRNGRGGNAYGFYFDPRRHDFSDKIFLGRSIKGGVQLAFLALGGWDTHINQGATQGQLANHLKPLGEGLAALVTGLGPTYRDTVILVISEFGRTVRENGNAGTDHGHGNVMWVMGGAVRGGKVYGDWPGLAEKNLYQKRDLAVTTDFRSAIGTVLGRHLRLDDRQLEVVFPAMPGANRNIDSLIRA